MKKEIFENPIVEVINLVEESVLTDSVPGGGGGGFLPPDEF